jgi:hypothetical protein
MQHQWSPLSPRHMPGNPSKFFNTNPTCDMSPPDTNQCGPHAAVSTAAADSAGCLPARKRREEQRLTATALKFTRAGWNATDPHNAPAAMHVHEPAIQLAEHTQGSDMMDRAHALHGTRKGHDDVTLCCCRQGVNVPPRNAIAPWAAHMAVLVPLAD